MKLRSLNLNRDEFAAARRDLTEELAAAIRPIALRAAARVGIPGWEAELLRAAVRAFETAFLTESDVRGDAADALAERFAEFVGDTLRLTSRKTGNVERQRQADTLSYWLATAAINAATEAAVAVDPDQNILLEWVSMLDEDVRSAHRDAHGQTRTLGGMFTVGGIDTHYPGEPVGDPSNWLNCRCVLRPTYQSNEFTSGGATMSQNPVEEVEVEEEEVVPLIEEDPFGNVPWHAVLAPEGVPSGDGRQFAKNALTNRKLPISLRWLPTDMGEHDGAVTVGRIDRIWRVGNLVYGEGIFDTSEFAYEAIRRIAESMENGISVDVDNAVQAVDEESEGAVFASARIAGATICPIPAFEEAFIALGPYAAEEAPTAQTPDENEEDMLSGATETFVSEKPWDGSASRFTPEQWKKSCILHVCDGDEKSCHKLPIREPGGALSRAGVHAAAARINQVDAPPDKVATAKSHLRGAYKELGEEIPDVLKAAGEVEEFERVPIKTKDGPGWITDPKPTKRITSYWVTGPGAIKIGWGVPGDFNRCRVQLAKYVQNPQWLAGLCANLHYRALGIWPGEHTLAPQEGLTASGAVNFVTDEKVLPFEWFTNPLFTEKTPVTVTDEGRVFGHVAAWDECHIGYPGECLTPPHSKTDYAHYLLGEVLTDGGRVPVGQIVIGSDHADGLASLRAATAHYANTGYAAADVMVGEDDFGIWCAGAVRDLSSSQLREFMAAKPSGDWRRRVLANGDVSYEMVGVLSVNVPGYAIPRIKAAFANGIQMSFVQTFAQPEVEQEVEEEVVETPAEETPSVPTAESPAEVDEVEDEAPQGEHPSEAAKEALRTLRRARVRNRLEQLLSEE